MDEERPHEDWVYDLDGKPWGVAEVESKRLSLRRDGGGGITRRYITPKVVPGGPDGATSVEIQIHHLRRSNLDQPFAPLNLATLKGGDWTRLELDSDETLMLFKHLENLYAIGAGGVRRGPRRLRVVEEGELVVSGDLAAIVAQLRDEHGEDDLLAIIEALLPDPLTIVALKREHATRMAALTEFKAHMAAGDWTELAWQAFFQRNEWIFGHGLAYQFLVDQFPQPYVGGTSLSGSGAQRGDMAMSTAGAWRFIVLVEIKKPNTLLLGPEYRNGAYEIGRHLGGGVAQLQANCERLISSADTRPFAQELARRRMSATDPQGILLIGHTDEFDDDAKRETFHRFRRNLWNPTVLTYDELLARARFLVGRAAPV
jgi:hypothetical protein